MWKKIIPLILMLLSLSLIVNIQSGNAQEGLSNSDKGKFASGKSNNLKITDIMNEEYWNPLTQNKWRFSNDEVILTEPGDPPSGPRRPFEYATLKKGPFRSIQMDADVKIDVPEPVGRDVVLLFGYQSDTKFYYVHLSEDNSIYPHNGIFKVNNDDRERINNEWDGSEGPPPAIKDQEYHHVRVKQNAETGEIAVYVDDMKAPLMTATDTTFNYGKIGFGSFDDIGRIRNLTVETDKLLNSVGLKKLVDNFAGEFEDETAFHRLKTHLNAIDHFEKKDLTDKVIKHLKGFKQLLTHQKNNELISEEAYNELVNETSTLISIWK